MLANAGCTTTRESTRSLDLFNGQIDATVLESGLELILPSRLAVRVLMFLSGGLIHDSGVGLLMGIYSLFRYWPERART